MGATLPLVAAPFWTRTGTLPGAPEHVGRDAFLAHARRAAADLPEAGFVINLCEDHYHFAVGFAAALLRGATSLLPPDRTAGTLSRLRDRYGEVAVLAGPADPHPGAGTEPLRLPPAPSGPPAGAGPVPAIPAGQSAVVAFTSGTTGEPRANRYSWGELAAAGDLSLDRLGPAPGGGVVATVPAQHLYGLELAILWPFRGGLGLHAERPFYPADVLDRLATMPEPRVLVTTPIHLKGLLEAGLDWPRTDRILSATAPLDPSLAEGAERASGAELWEIYGCSEGGSLASRRTARDPLWRWHPGVRPAGGGADGALEAEHLGRTVPLNDAIEAVDGERFRLKGRREDLVKVAGKRASLAELNRVLTAIPGVRDGLFLAPAQEDGRPAALVVAPELSREDILEALARDVDAVFLPRPLHFVDALPRTAAGKLPRARLAPLLRALGEDP
ncbi:MAG TPA: AMP-binding protein [Gammaproteobacteria bacterium]|nr:AMP-binding protein [Gammaproteobacteria bacterium]